MKKETRYRWIWSGTLLLLLVLQTICISCSSDESEDEPRLNIYIYAPERPAVTRSEIIPTENEAKIYNLQIWVFRSSDPTKKVASLSLTTEEELAGLNNSRSDSYSIELTDLSFVRNPEPVDIYVLANQIGNNGTEYKDPIVNSQKLDKAVFDGGHFFSFMESPHKAVTSIPEGKGVPMSGVARGRSVFDQNNVLHINDANLRLVRDVSKIRFVFSSLKGENDAEALANQIFVEGITLDKNMMYYEERFFLDKTHPNFWVEGGTLNEEVALVESSLNSPVAQNDDPTQYAYSSSMTEAGYEAKLDEWTVGDHAPLTQFPVVYLPESDKKLTGIIKYRVGSNTSETKTAPFTMIGSDFRRNQTWVVYAYYIGSSKLEVNTVKVTEWDPQNPEDPHELHNW
ncbi:MAG: hypothetical protein IK075_12145 [Prevotella sp.]|nr:hypothetical protein [Prevotella sp.]